MDHRDTLYQTYASFKSWDGAAGPGDDTTYAVEVMRAGLKPRSMILEIGFGEGRFLDWVAREGHNVTGVELIEDLVTSARRRGHKAFHGTAQSVLGATEDRFDLIVAFDVFEHLTADELLDLMRFAKTILAPGGRILARFPNGSSPFGIHIQNGDFTHMLALTGERMMQIAHAAGMKVTGVYNAARCKKGGAVHGRLKKRAGYLARDAIEVTVGLLYFGHRIPLDPNLTVIIGGHEEIGRGEP
jgi:2-polyprenyl-3-methyl-5-hydroxy-6-metoxy-1,4-benzoquinol methylase